jgi:hypothetical protein
MKKITALIVASLVVMTIGSVAAASASAASASPPPPKGYQPTPPITAAFFYPWYSQPSLNWYTVNGMPFTHYHPVFGFYNSTDDSIIDQQLQLAKDAGIQAMISSWDGPGYFTDTALQHIVARSERVGSPYQDMRWSIYYEKEGFGDPTVSQIVSDLHYLQAHFFGQPGWLWVNGKPVVFVYADALDNCTLVDRWIQARQQSGVSVYLVLHAFPGYKACTSQPDDWHQYYPVAGYLPLLPYSVSVSPGFFKWNELNPRLERDINRFTNDILKMKASGATWQLITTWNEWPEGTSVEPANEFSTAYLDAIVGKTPALFLDSSPTSVPTTPSL